MGVGRGDALLAASVPGALNAACEAELQAEEQAEGLPATQASARGRKERVRVCLLGPSLISRWIPGRPSGLACPAAAPR